ncbi:MAG: pyruvate kinase, partial [Pseudonocardiales bacterium]|nr:pyruvate kinase [Pseudonocardiales bacterium]
MIRHAKIVCTLGPATDSPERARALVEAGMDVARLNFSHGEHAEHGRRFREVRQAASAAGRNVAVLADLQGPKIRLGRFADGPVIWATGERVRITVEECEGTHDRVSTTYSNLAADVRPGDRLLVDDGNVALIAVAVENDTDVVCDVAEGGVVSDNKGLSLPGVEVSVPAMSDKDEADLEFALRLGVDYVALSFVRNPEDVKLVHRVMDEVGVRVPVIAKLEKPEAVDRLEEIVLAFDGMMVARGDLGVEMPLEEVPMVQKRAVQICRDNAKPVIVATQMLESMITHSRPTRAEASDVANAVIDGADAVMLSGETSVGKYPVQAVATMSRIITTVEASGTQVTELRHVPRTPGGAIVKAAKDIGDALGAVALVAF